MNLKISKLYKNKFNIIFLEWVLNYFHLNEHHRIANCYQTPWEYSQKHGLKKLWKTNSCPEKKFYRKNYVRRKQISETIEFNTNLTASMLNASKQRSRYGEIQVIVHFWFVASHWSFEYWFWPPPLLSLHIKRLQWQVMRHMRTWRTYMLQQCTVDKQPPNILWDFSNQMVTLNSFIEHKIIKYS